MKDTITENQFIDGMQKFVNWEIETLRELFQLLEDYEVETGTEMEFDPVGIRCEYSEYDSLEQISEEYGRTFETIEELQEETVAIDINIPQYFKAEQNVNKILVQNY